MSGVAEGGSYRDPSGRVYEREGRIFRTVAERAAPHYEYLRDRGLLRRWAEQGWVVASEEREPGALPPGLPAARYVLEHPRLPFVSYPYEWPFPALKAAALLHLDLQRQALEEGVSLSDASAYNVQFLGPRPIFIDVLSFRRYREGEFWAGHRQFCEQFLNPLLLRALCGVPHNAWYRGSLEGIPSDQLGRLLPLRRKLSWNVLSHVVLPARGQRSAADAGAESLARLRERQLSRVAYQGLLAQLRDWIARLEPLDTGPTVLGDYERSHGYAQEEHGAKQRFVAEFVQRTKPRLLCDFGCNTGAYSELALASGAERVLGFDFDQGALEKAFARARTLGLDLLPLFLDAANPSPGQGWNGVERASMQGRVQADGALALAFVHHLAIGRNVPLDQAVHWVVERAPRGVIEFVDKGDPTVQTMLALREDIFERYAEPAFVEAIEQRARIVRAEQVSRTGRKLFEYERR